MLKKKIRLKSESVFFFQSKLTEGGRKTSSKKGKAAQSQLINEEGEGGDLREVVSLRNYDDEYENSPSGDTHSEPGKRRVNLADFSFIKVLGKGSFGKVSRVSFKLVYTMNGTACTLM